MIRSMRRRTVLALVGALTAGTFLFVGTPSAFAGVGLGATANTPGLLSGRNTVLRSMTVGETLPADVEMHQVNSTGDTASRATVTKITYVPSCGPAAGSYITNNVANPCKNPNVGIFKVAPTAVGFTCETFSLCSAKVGFGRACTGIQFNVTPSALAPGTYDLTPKAGQPAWTLRNDEACFIKLTPSRCSRSRPRAPCRPAAGSRQIPSGLPRWAPRAAF